MLTAALVCVSIALWSGTSWADPYADERTMYQRRFGLNTTPKQIPTKAYKIDGAVKLSVDIEGTQVLLHLQEQPVVPLDGKTLQYTYGCTSAANLEFTCSAMLTPVGDVYSLFVYRGTDTWIFEGVGNGMSIVYKPQDIVRSEYQELVLEKSDSMHQRSQIRRQVPGGVAGSRSNPFLDGAIFGYSSQNNRTRMRRSTLRIVRLRMTYDKAYLVALDGNQDTVATIERANFETRDMLNHVNTIYSPQVGIVFELYEESRLPEQGSNNGNYAGSDMLDVFSTFTSDLVANTDDLNLFISGMVFPGLSLETFTTGAVYAKAAFSHNGQNAAMLTPLNMKSLYSQVSVMSHLIGHSFGCYDSFEVSSVVMDHTAGGSRYFGAECRENITQHVQNTESGDVITYLPSSAQAQVNTNPCFAAAGATGVCGFGECSVVGDSYTCSCGVSGFTGRNCELPIETCPESGQGWCRNGGHCVDTSNTYRCACPTGFLGYLCQYESCAANPCVTGTCSNIMNAYNMIIGFSCGACAPGYSGSRCEIGEPLVNPCRGMPCGIGGTCSSISAGTDYTCACDTGYMISPDSKQCTPVNYCDPNPCGPGATCVNDIDTYKCTCPPGYQLSGVTCVNHCDPDPCGPGGSCENDQNTHKCTCLPGYELSEGTCQLDTNVCAPHPCNLDEVCVAVSDDPRDGHRCCPVGWGGRNCGEYLGSCAAGDACMNGAKCMPFAGVSDKDKERMPGAYSYTCDCDPGYEGVRCGQLINYCVPSNPCVKANTKYCQKALLSVTCVCKPGWGGDNCETWLNQCGQGTPVEDHNEKGVCQCPAGWEGDQCERPPRLDSSGKNICEMANIQCSGRGNCRNIDKGNGVMHPQCTCFDGWDGYDCSTVTYDSCEGNPCMFGGTCQSNRNGSFKCKCVMGRSGDLCQLDINECADKPCFVGRCSNRHNKFVCVCPTGWSGPTCNKYGPS